MLVALIAASIGIAAGWLLCHNDYEYMQSELEAIRKDVAISHDKLVGVFKSLQTAVKASESGIQNDFSRAILTLRKWVQSS